MNCLWIILLLSCFGGCGCNSGCGGGCRHGQGGDHRETQKKGCRRAVERAVNECGSEKAVMRTLKNRDSDCRPEKPDCAEMQESNNSCEVPNMNPPHWQDFPEVSRSASRDDCDCES